FVTVATRGSRDHGPSAEDGLVDQLATSGAPQLGREFRNLTALKEGPLSPPHSADISAALRAADENDPGGRQPIVSGPSKSPIQEADSDQEDSNIYGCPGTRTSGLEVSNPIFAGPDSDEE
uniref:PCDH1 n=1 Tax=Macrostomum lignano TaxID=282301 RepID=A0A1I8F821_9PLAT